MNFLWPEPYILCPSDLCWTYLQSYLSTVHKEWWCWGSLLAQNLTQVFSEENRLSEFPFFPVGQAYQLLCIQFCFSTPFPLPFPLHISLLLNRFLSWSICPWGHSRRLGCMGVQWGSPAFPHTLKGKLHSSSTDETKSGRTESRGLQEGGCLFL